MKPIQINVAGTTATVTKSGTLTTGLVGQAVAFTFDEAWDGLSRCAVFKAGNTIYTRLNIDDTATIPPELLRTPGRQISVGVYGYDAEGTVVIPTVWALLGTTQPGAYPSGQESTDPALPIWAQLEGRVEALEESGATGGGTVAPDKVILLEESTYDFSYSEIFNAYAHALTQIPFVLQSGQQYIVVWDGVEYTRTAFSFTRDGAACVGIGNPLIAGEESNGDMFAVVADTTNDYCYFFSLETTDTHTVSIYQKDEFATQSYVRSYVEDYIGSALEGDY